MNLQDLYFVIVLYKTSLEDSKTISTLNTVLSNNINLMVYDNSPIRQYQDDCFVHKKFNIKYHHNANNSGLSHAYNYALNNAVVNHNSWLLLLDQDTSFSKSYIDELLSLEVNDLMEEVVCIMPKVISSDNNVIISPSKMSLGGICRPISIKPGITNSLITGINSGTILKVSFMNSLNGFSPNYSLDMLDHWYFREIMKNCKSIYLLKSVIHQNLSVFGDFENNVSLNRYQQLLAAESFFIKDEHIGSQLVFKIRLVLRSLKQLKYNNKDYYKSTIKAIFK